jgi:hypothetical protein
MRILFCVISALLCFAMSCTYNNLEEMNPEKICTNDSIKVVSFNQHILPVLVTECAISGCHNSASHKGGLVLEASVAYNELVQGEYVDTINPKYSVLYSSLVSVSDPMPPTGKLDQCDINLIERWMQQKAKNN